MGFELIEAGRGLCDVHESCCISYINVHSGLYLKLDDQPSTISAVAIPLKMPQIWEVYAHELRDFFPVHAFYEPVKKSDINPGDVGYLDRDGGWVWLQRLPDAVNPRVDEPRYWGPRCSNSIAQSEVKLKARYEFELPQPDPI